MVPCLKTVWISHLVRMGYLSIQTVTMASLPYDEFMGDLRNRYTLRLAILEIVEAAI